MTRKPSMSYRLGAYEADVTIEIFEEDGYVNYKDLDLFFSDCYFDFETKLSKEDFIKISKENLIKHPKYREFMNNEVKMCGQCGLVKPLTSLKKDYRNSDKRGSTCHHCAKEWIIDKYHRDEEFRSKRKAYAKKWNTENKEKFYKIRDDWNKRNEEKVKKQKTKSRIKSKLIQEGYTFNDEGLDRFINIKLELGIRSFNELVSKFGSVLNG